MTAERKPKGKKKIGAGGAAAAAAGSSSEQESYDGMESARGQSKRRASSPSAADVKHGSAVGGRRCCGWPLCLLAVSLAVAVASSACFFYGDVVLDSLDECGMNTAALRELYNSAVGRRLVADESTSKHAASTSDGDHLSSVDHLAAVDDQPEGSDEPEGDAGEQASNSPYDEVATDRNEEAAVGSSDYRLPNPAEAEEADGLSEAEETFVPPQEDLSSGDDDVVLSIGKATDDRWEPTERQPAAAPADSGDAEGEQEPAVGGVPPLATTDVPLSSEYDLLAKDLPSGTVEPQSEGQQQHAGEQLQWQHDEQQQWQQEEQQQWQQDEQSQWQQDEQQQQQNEQQPWQQQDEQQQRQQQDEQQQQQQEEEQQHWQQYEQQPWQQQEEQQQPWQQQEEQQQQQQQQDDEQRQEQQEQQRDDEQQNVDSEAPSRQLPADDSGSSAVDTEPIAAAAAAYNAQGEQQHRDDASAPPADDGEQAASPDGVSYAGSDAITETGDDRAYSESYQEAPFNPDFVDLGQPDLLSPAAGEAYQPDTLPFDEPAAAWQSGESADAVEAGTEAGVAADAPLRSYIEVETLVGVESPASAPSGEADDYLIRSDLEASERLAAFVPSDDPDVPNADQAAWDASTSADYDGPASASAEQGYSHVQATVTAHEDVPQDVEPNDWQPTPPKADAGDAEGEQTTLAPPHGFRMHDVGLDQSEVDGPNDAEAPTADHSESDLLQPAFGVESDWSAPQDAGLDRSSVGYDYQPPDSDASHLETGHPNAFADAAYAVPDVSYVKLDQAELPEEQRLDANVALAGDNSEPVLDSELRPPANEDEVYSTGYESLNEGEASDDLKSASMQAESEPLVLAPSWGYPDEFGLAPEREGEGEQANVEQSGIPSE